MKGVGSLVLETSRSIKRSLLSEYSHGGRNNRKGMSPTALPLCTAQEQSLISSLSRTKTGILGEDLAGSTWSSRIKWLACFTFLVLAGVIGIGFHSLANDSLFLPSPCTGNYPSIFGEGALSEENFELPVEDPKCLSRTRHLLYRNVEHQTPHNPQLYKALSDYALLHSKCSFGDGRVFFGDKKNKSSCKYLVYLEGTEGLGNRLLSLVSAFTYALATDRVLLIDSGLNLDGMLCEPFAGSSWVLPAGFDSEMIRRFPGLDGLFQTKGEVAGVMLNLRHVQSDEDKMFFCAATQERLAGVKLIGWKSNQYYVTRLLMVPAFWAKLSPLFSDPSHAFTHLSRHLLLPTNEIWGRTERVYRGYLARTKRLIGIQVRAPLSPGFSQEVQNRFLSCLFPNDIVPALSNVSVARHSLFHQGKARDVTIFVASLHRGYFDSWREVYLAAATRDGSFVTVHTLDSDEVENQSNSQSVDAFMDMWLLSFSDTLVTSAWSTFGYVAQGIGGIHPYLINTDETTPMACYGGQSMEPCTHFPFLEPGCGNASLSIEHAEWVKKHVHPCQDEPSGLQFM